MYHKFLTISTFQGEESVHHEHSSGQEMNFEGDIRGPVGVIMTERPLTFNSSPVLMKFSSSSCCNMTSPQ